MDDRQLPLDQIRLWNNVSIPLDTGERLPVEAIGDWQRQIDRYLELVDASRDEYEFINAPLARYIGRVAHRLLDRYGSLPADHQLLVSLAVKHFLNRADGEDDFASPLGFHDDADLFNIVLDRLGLPEWRLVTNL